MDSKLRVLFLSFYYKPDLCAGSFRSTSLITSLKEILPEQSSIDVITTLPNRYASFSKRADLEEQDGLVHIHRVSLPRHKSGMLDQSKAFFFYFKGVAHFIKDKEYDAVFATSSRLMTAFMGAYISRKRALPLFLDIRDIFVDTLSDILPKKISFLVLPLFSLIECWTMRQASHINLVSKGFGSYFSERYPQVPLTFFSNGIDCDFIIHDTTNLYSKKENNKVQILYAGNIGEGQGLHKIIPRFAEKLANQAEFIIIGDGGCRELLRERVKEKKVTNVQFIDPVSREELLKYYDNCDVLFLHLNDYSAFKKVLPSKIFEYGALNKPILAGVGGYAADFIRNELDGAEVFKPCDVDMAVEAFNQLKARPTTHREQFISKYSRNKIMNQMASEMLKVWK